MAQSQTTILEVFKWDNSKVQVGLADLGKLTFSGTDLVLNMKSGDHTTIPTTSIRNMVFNTVNSVQTPVSVTGMKLYPNPAVDFIRVENLPEGSRQLIIFSLSGQVMQTVQLLEGENQIDIRHFHRGIYLVKVGTQVTKFTKQ